MIPLETRKKHTQIILHGIQNFLFKITGNDTISGFIIYLLHAAVAGPTLVHIIIGEVNLFFYLSLYLFYQVMKKISNLHHF